MIAKTFLKRKSNTLLAILIIFLMGAGTAFAKIKVVSVRGKVAYKNGGSWKPVRKGMTLNAGSKVSTGIRSTAVLHFMGKGNTHKVTVKPLTMMKIYENSVSQDKGSKSKYRTRIGLRRGSIRAKVSRKRKVRTIFKVSTPVATSSVRGTEEVVSYGPSKGMVVEVVEGSIQGENKNGSSRTIGGKQVFHQQTNTEEPKDPLSKVKDGASVSIYDGNVTRDEKTRLDHHHNSGFIDSDHGGLGFFDHQQGTRIKVELQWEKK
ncbi:MAG: FecR domain-containing protein [bacterium]|nr:FecR domain-containing protein [bacterium]